jgi:hypothetical protein
MLSRPQYIVTNRTAGDESLTLCSPASRLSLRSTLDDNRITSYWPAGAGALAQQRGCLCQSLG